jgi:hypothetical protein
MYDVIHLVGDRAYTVLSNVSLEAANLYVKRSCFDLEIVQHRDKTKA